MASFPPPSIQSIRSYILSLNSGVQAKTITDLIVGAQPRHVLMDPILIPIGLLIYLGLKPHFTLLCRTLKTTGKSPLFRFLVLMHNVFLSAFSFWTASNVIPLTYNYYISHGFDKLYCTRGLWVSGLHYWGFLFYLSKYLELLDTAVLIVKGKEPSYLQVYHHSVTILIAYGLQASHSGMSYVFVGLNSTVHTVMYAYYALTVLGVRLGAKSLITVMQLVQFVVGIILAFPIIVLHGGKGCVLISEKIAVGGSLLHAAYLAKLFTQFFSDTYRKKTKQA